MGAQSSPEVPVGWLICWLVCWMVGSIGLLVGWSVGWSVDLLIVLAWEQDLGHWQMIRRVVGDKDKHTVTK